MDDDDIPWVSCFCSLNVFLLTDYSTLIEAETTLDAPPLEQTTSDSYTVPLTIICGFLGAGKSTLVRYVLHRYAVYHV